MGIFRLTFLSFITVFIFTHSAAGPVVPVEKSGKFALELNPIYFEVDPEIGGRITSLKWEGEEILFLDKNASSNWGSTFWPSPQKSWRRQWGTQDWPPSEVLDTKPYTGGIQGNKIVLKSEYDEWNKIQLEKSFEADNSDSSITVTYTMHTQADTGTPSWAPWEITRLMAKGMMFFPTGPGGVEGQLKQHIKELEGHSWFFYERDKLGGGGKIFMDGLGGWLAHVDDQGFLLVKKFPEVNPANAAKGEAEIEIYCNAGGLYWEMEQQGAFREIKKDTPYAWPVKWYLRKIASGTKVEPGNMALVDIVKDLITPVNVADFTVPTRSSIQSEFPFKVNPLTDFITFNLHTPGEAELILLSLSGSVISRTRLGRLQAGIHRIPVDHQTEKGLKLGRLILK